MSNEKISELTKLEIGSDVTNVSDCFGLAQNLKDITIPSSVTIISEGALAKAASLQQIIFKDLTAEQIYEKWQNIASIGILQIDLAKDKDGVFVNPFPMKLIFVDGTESDLGFASTGVTKALIRTVDYTNLESLDLNHAKVYIAGDSFEDCNKLVELIADAYTCQEVADNVESWGLGIAEDGTTHLVVVYCSDGVVVINDADSSSGELAPTINWEEFSKMLEDMPNMVSMPKVGSSLNVKYKVDVNADFIDTEWQILGYNGSIPEYVKYKNGDERIFVRSLEEDQNNTNYQLLKSSFSGSPIYSRSDDGTFTVVSGKIVSSVGSDLFTYSQTNAAWGTTATGSGSYSVPMSITVDDKTYTFAGYNMTLAPKYLLGVKSPYNNKMYYHMQFDSGRGYIDYGQNDWSTSMARSWFNDNLIAIADRCAGQQWQDEFYANGNSATTLQLTNGLVDRIQTGSKSFYAHVMPTVNRTWTFAYTGSNTYLNDSNTTYQNTFNWKYRRDKSGNIITNGDITKAKSDGMKYLDGSQCEHVVDKFWLLGVGSVNCSGSEASRYFDGYQYETAIYSELFKNADIWNSESSRIRFLMKEDGTKMAIASSWWLRSASSDTINDNYSRNVGYVDNYGGVYSYYASSTYIGALLPACTIY